MTEIRRGTIMDVRLDPTLGSETGKTRPCLVVTNDTYNAHVPVIQVVPITEWSARKAQIVTNVEIAPTPANGLSKRSLADCLQTRPIDRRIRMVRMRGRLETDLMVEVNRALRCVFALDEPEGGSAPG